MNIAIITTGILPVPAIKGGAVETLIDILINYNEDHPEHFITIFGTYDKEFERMDFSKYKRTKFVLTNNHSFVTKLRRKIFQYSHSSFFYNYYLDFFAAEVSKKVATGNYDVLISPVAPTPAFKLGEHTADPIQMYLADIMTVPPSLAGLPAISVPAGESEAGLPIGVQLIGDYRTDARLLKLASEVEAA